MLKVLRVAFSAWLKWACAADPALCPLHFPCKSAPHSPRLCCSQLPEKCSESAPLINRHETITGWVTPLSTMGQRRTGFTGSLAPFVLPPSQPRSRTSGSDLQLQLDSWNAAKPWTQQPLKCLRQHLPSTLVLHDAFERAWLVHACKAHSLIHSFLYSGPSSHFISTELFTVGLSRSSSQKKCGHVPGKRDLSTLKKLFASLLFSPVLPQEFLLKVFGKHRWRKKKEKDFEERKTSRSWATHTPSAVVLSSFIICALIWFLQLGVLLIRVVVVFFLRFSGTKQQGWGGGGHGFSPVCI